VKGLFLGRGKVASLNTGEPLTYWDQKRAIKKRHAFFFSCRDQRDRESEEIEPNRRGKGRIAEGSSNPKKRIYSVEGRKRERASCMFGGGSEEVGPTEKPERRSTLSGHRRE